MLAKLSRPSAWARSGCRSSCRSCSRSGELRAAIDRRTIRSWRCSTGAPRWCEQVGRDQARAAARRFTCPGASARARAADRARRTAPSRARRCGRCSARSCRPASRSRARWSSRTPGPRRPSATWRARRASACRRASWPPRRLGEVFREIGRGADYGVVPVEEATRGAGHATRSTTSSTRDLLDRRRDRRSRSRTRCSRAPGRPPASSGSTRTRRRRRAARRGWSRRSRASR